MEDLLNQLVDAIPQLVGLDVSTFYAILAFVVTVCNLLGRVIPDSATGTLGVVRKVCKVVGLYLGNRVTPQVSVNDAASALAATVPDSTIKYAADNIDVAIEDGKPVGSLANALASAADVPTAGKQTTRSSRKGPFAGQKVRSPMVVGLIAILGAFFLGGCATTGTSIPTSPAAVANQTVLDEKVGIAVETLYTTFAKAGALAFQVGIIMPSTNPAVQSDDFCVRVTSNQISVDPDDKGLWVASLECKLRYARDKTRAAYNAGNATDYDLFARQAIAFANELMSIWDKPQN